MRATPESSWKLFTYYSRFSRIERIGVAAVRVTVIEMKVRRYTKSRKRFRLSVGNAKIFDILILTKNSRRRQNIVLQIWFYRARIKTLAKFYWNIKATKTRDFEWSISVRSTQYAFLPTVLPNSEDNNCNGGHFYKPIWIVICVEIKYLLLWLGLHHHFGGCPHEKKNETNKVLIASARCCAVFSICPIRLLIINNNEYIAWLSSPISNGTKPQFTSSKNKLLHFWH